MDDAPTNLRKTGKAEFRLGEWRVLPDLNQLRRNGDVVSLQNLSMQVLVYLAEHHRQVVTYDQLLTDLWPGRVVSEDAVHRRVADLRRHLGDSRSNPKYIETIPKKGYRLIASVGPVRASQDTRWRRPAFISGAILGAALLAAWMGTGSLTPGARLATPVPAEVSRISIESTPPNTMVHYRQYSDQDSEWRPLGLTPLEAELPHGTWTLRLTADGRETIELAAPNPSRIFNNVDRDFYTIEMPLAQDVPDGMVFVPGGRYRVPIFGFFTDADLGNYFIDKTEVSNREYKEFVAANGYGRAEFWSELESSSLSSADVATMFVDTTGQAGPADWIDGSYPAGREDYPVTGVSWYEAAAYAQFRGMRLPTARHWARAALGIDENNWPLAAALLPAANIDGTAPLPVTASDAVSTWGALNLIGNVREWTATSNNESKVTAGLGFRGPEWAYAFPGLSLPMERNSEQGFRLAKYDAITDDIVFDSDAMLPVVPDVSDTEYEEIRAMFDYAAGTITPAMTRRLTSTRETDWIREKYLIESDALHEPLPVIIFRPAGNPDPLQPVIYLPPGSSYTGQFPSDEITLDRFDIDFVVESGRALVWPIIAGTHERYKPRPRLTRQQLEKRWLRGKRLRRAEIGAVIDFLENDPAFAGDKVSVLAASFGATFVTPHILAFEDRIQAAMLVSSTLASVDPRNFGNAVNPNTYWPHVDKPILVLNGRYDIATHLSAGRDELLLAIGTPPQNKRGVQYESSHWPLPQHRVRKDVLDWLDHYVGTVD